MNEHLDDLPPPRSTLTIIEAILGKLDSYHHSSPEDRARRFAALLSLEGKQVLDAIPMPRTR